MVERTKPGLAPRPDRTYFNTEAINRSTPLPLDVHTHWMSHASPASTLCTTSASGASEWSMSVTSGATQTPDSGRAR